ncbi:unnamed protein product [Calypogeia fissa]
MSVSSNIFWFQSCLKVLRFLQSDGRIWEHGGGEEHERRRNRIGGLRFYGISAFRTVAVHSLGRSSLPSLILSSASAAGVQLCSILHCARIGTWMRQLPARRGGIRKQGSSTTQKSAAVKHVLCLSNGHGEDSIAVSVLAQLMALADENGEEIVVEALPLVGLGSAYSHAGIPVLGPCKNMPSGGFLYMDILNLVGDIRAGLVFLTLGQWRTILRWMDENPDAFIVAVGDVFPLTLAWLASLHARRKRKKRNSFGYAFVGTAKSEFYIDGEDALSSKQVKRFHVASVFFRGGVYLPWERFMMADNYCRLIAPRDGLTSEMLTKHLPSTAQSKVRNLGNPMMCALRPDGTLEFLKHYAPGRFIALLPGSRAPEVYSNWRILLEASECVTSSLSPNKVVFLTPVVPSLQPGHFYDQLLDAGWQPQRLDGEPLVSRDYSQVEECERKQMESWPAHSGTSILRFAKSNAILLLLRGGFSDAGHWAEAGIAMAGTGTEQLVGLGKPVFTIPGRGPQFTYAFAEAQARLLGKSIFLSSDCESLAVKVREVLSNKEFLAEIAENGLKRMGTAGGARRIAEHVLISFPQN